MLLIELALFMFKFQAKQLPFSLSDYFKLTNAIHAKQTRLSNLQMTIIFFLVTKR